MALDALAGGAFLAVAVAASGGPRRYALLAAVAGVAWFAGGVQQWALWLHRPLMLHCALADPSGRLRGWPARAVVALAWVTALVPQLARAPAVSLLLGAGVGVAGWRLWSRASLSRRTVASATPHDPSMTRDLPRQDGSEGFWPLLKISSDSWRRAPHCSRSAPKTGEFLPTVEIKPLVR